ncbi:family 13 alpha amylase in complex with acarbose [Massarina eburnea CBS 473.64]|uniref:alpha-amylase n=1 Tax=Massarina eburnea CBS 473.64 TaxID=1395130 RepID=A0A6A6RFH2_9PLEO|nr:family 13 alpha amylase in complex with acarbose [Massarina eburnea CBS 473.64]
MKLGQLLAVTSALAHTTLAASADQWRSRSIYQLLTDRFARTDGSTTAKCNTEDGEYCGGTYQGIIKQLDYIQDMGFTAIWISPVTYQIPEKTKFGYAWHGYWAQDLYRLNEAFGSESDLKALSKALHDRDMYLMIDIVPNHNGWNGTDASIDYSRFNPFNDKKYYHNYCEISDYANQTEVEDCWLGDSTVPLVDVKTDDETVGNMYNTWIHDLVSNYSIDGLRIDTVKYVGKPFWSSFQSAAGVFATGEVVADDADYACDYQNYLNSVLNYPAYYPMMSFLNSTSGTTENLLSATQDLKASCKDVSLLGTFTENHDLPRFASQTQDMALAKNALALTLLWDGIPIIYAGQEQHYSGFADPANREATWLAGYSRDSELYKLTAAVNQVRNRALTINTTYSTYDTWAVWNDTNTIALRKGFDGKQIVSIFTNKGNSSDSWTLSLPSTSSGWTSGFEVVEVLTCAKLTVDTDGNLNVPMEGGAPRIYFPTAAVGDSGICADSVSPGSASSNGTSSSVANAGLNAISDAAKRAAAVAAAAVAAIGGL